MKNIYHIAGWLGVIRSETSGDCVIRWLKEAASALGFGFTGVGASVDGEYVLLHDGFPAGAYASYQQVFGESDPISRWALSSNTPHLWHAADLAAQSGGAFDANGFGVEWGLSTSVRLDGGERAIISVASDKAPRSEESAWHLTAAAAVLSFVVADTLHRLGYFNVDGGLTNEQLQLLSRMASSEGGNRKKLAASMHISTEKLGRNIRAICATLGVETEAQALLKVAPQLNSKKWEQK